MGPHLSILQGHGVLGGQSRGTGQWLMPSGVMRGHSTVQQGEPGEGRGPAVSRQCPSPTRSRDGSAVFAKS